MSVQALATAGRSRGNKQVDKNAKGKSTDSNKRTRERQGAGTSLEIKPSQGQEGRQT